MSLVLSWVGLMFSHRPGEGTHPNPYLSSPSFVQSSHECEEGCSAGCHEGSRESSASSLGGQASGVSTCLLYSALSACCSADGAPRAFLPPEAAAYSIALTCSGWSIPCPVALSAWGWCAGCISLPLPESPCWLWKDCAVGPVSCSCFHANHLSRPELAKWVPRCGHGVEILWPG